MPHTREDHFVSSSVRAGARIEIERRYGRGAAKDGNRASG